MMEAMKVALNNLQQKQQAKIFLGCLITMLALLVLNDLIIFRIFKGSNQGNNLNETRNLIEQRIQEQHSVLKTLVKADVDKVYEIIRTQTAMFGKVIGDQRVELYEVINDQVTKAEEQLKKEKAKIYEEIDLLKEAIQNHKGISDSEMILQKLRDLDVYREEATAIFEFDNITEFLASELQERQASEYIFCRGIKWYLGLQTSEIEKKKYLQMRLYAHNPSDSFSAWSIKTNFEITLLNEDNSLNVIKKYENERFQKSPNLMDDFKGKAEYAEISELMEKGFAKNDRIKVQVHLTAEPLKRQGYVNEDRIRK